MSWGGADFLQSGFRQSLGYRYICLCTLVEQGEFGIDGCYSDVQEDTWEGPQQWRPEWKKYTGIWDIIDSQLLPGDQDAIEHYRQNPPLQDREHPDTPFFFFFFLGYRIVVHSFQAKEPSGHQTNLRYAGTTA